jgi:hypothetical protein
VEQPPEASSAAKPAATINVLNRMFFPKTNVAVGPQFTPFVAKPVGKSAVVKVLP